MRALTSRLRYSWVLAIGLASGCAHFVPRPLSPQHSIAAFRARALGDPGLREFLADNRVPAPAPGGRWSLKALTLVAVYYQPLLAEARAQLLAAQAGQITAGERPNPSGSVAPGYDNGVPNSHSPWVVPIAFDWTIETAGRRGDRIALALHHAAAARWDLVGTVWEVRSRLRTALLNLYAAHRSESLLARKESALWGVVAQLEGQFSAGSVSSFEVTQARVALDNTILARQAADGRIRQARIQLAGALGIAPRALTGVKLSSADLKVFPRQLTRPQLRRQALLDRADVRAALEQYAASQSALQLEIARQWPDIDLGPGYIWNGQFAGDSEWQLGLSLKLPVLNRNQGPIAEAKAQRKLAAAHFLTVQTTAIGQIDGALAAYRTAQAQMTTADSLLGNLQQRLSAVRSQVEVGELQPLDLADAEVAFDTGAQNQLKTQIEAQQALGRLEDALQSPLTLAPSTLRAAQSDPHRATK
ncbi:MAG: TolC family protein [Metallibacterium sp.]